MKFNFKCFGILAIAAALVSGCDNSPSGSSSSADSGNNAAVVDSASPRADSSTADSATSRHAVTNANPDQATIDYLITGNAKETAWLMAAEKNGTDKEMRMHAKMMLADHKKLGTEVTQIISGKNLAMPPIDTMREVNLTEAKGKEWDKAWVDKMVLEHTELLGKLKQSQVHVMDSSLKKLVTNTERVVQGHLDMAKKMQDKMK